MGLRSQAMRSLNGHFSLCGRCGRPPVHTVSCPICGRSCCRWQCYNHHLGQHLAARSSVSAASNGFKEEAADHRSHQPADALRPSIPLLSRTEIELSA
jgi:hypothetical protein